MMALLMYELGDGESLTRRQLAVFLLKAKEGSSYTPPPAVGIFGDVLSKDPFAT